MAISSLPLLLASWFWLTALAKLYVLELLTRIWKADHRPCRCPLSFGRFPSLLVDVAQLWARRSEWCSRIVTTLIFNLQNSNSGSKFLIFLLGELSVGRYTQYYLSSTISLTVSLLDFAVLSFTLYRTYVVYWRARQLTTTRLWKVILRDGECSAWKPDE